MPDASDRLVFKTGPVRHRRDIGAALALATAVLVGTARLPAQTAVAVPPPECQAGDDRIAVLLVGSYHMANPGLDRFNLEADDVLTPRRQAEIEAVTSRLATFRPTKVAIEAPYGSQSVANAFREYVQEARALRRNESEQIGFRLARRAGHAAIYPIDVQAPFDDAGVRALAENNPSHGRRMKDLTVFGQTVMAGMADTLAKGTIGDMLAAMNGPDALRVAHWPYVRYYAPIVEGDQYAGADLVANWYGRNLRIFANLNRIAAPKDRIVVVYGQGHVPILRELVGASPAFCRADPLAFLGSQP